MRARKRFGQHFLTDAGVLQAIAAAVALQADDPVLEIGPGQGALTEVLAPGVARYVAVEIDRDLVPLLKVGFPQLEVVNADILRVDLAELLDAAQPWRVVGNLPYNISSPLLIKLTDFARQYPGRLKDLHFMLQREMADRLLAQHGSKAWGRLSVMAQLQFDVEHILDVAPESFAPPPKVWSSVIRLLPRSRPVPEVDVAVLDRVLRFAFAGRRKRLSNSLKPLGLDWSALALDPGLRADNVSLEDYVAIARLAEKSHSGVDES